MTARELDEIGAESVAGDSFRPLGANKLIVAANHVSATDRGNSGSENGNAFG
jgi:hypothetical protein